MWILPLLLGAALSAPSPAPSVDPKTCKPSGPAVRFEIKDDDHLTTFDAAGCPLGESSFKANGFSYQKALDFMSDLQRRVKAADKEGLADITQFPTRVGKKTIKSRAAFLHDYDHIYSPALTAALLAQNPQDLFCNSQGVMLGNGIVWVTTTEDRYYVKAINFP